MKTLLLLSICILCLSWASCYRNSFKVIPITTTSTIRTNRKSGVLPTIINKNTQLHALSTDPILKNIQSFTKAIASAITSNPVVRVISNTYSFFYWFPRNNLPYDMPWMLFKNSSVEWLAWYQIPHNLPPYGYLGEGYPEDFFCFGLPGNTLPLGNWDPWGFQLVTKKVVRKYRESELKHGRLAMLATVGMIVQEIDHPLHQTIGGMAITHMEQLASLPLKDSLLFSVLKNFVDIKGIGEMELPLDYMALMLMLMAFEATAFKRNWRIWARNEYNHQFDHNIGVGNLRDDYENGNYGFDPLNLFPQDPYFRRDMQNRELNNGRLAMIAFVGMLFQEYFTGVPISAFFVDIQKEIDVTAVPENVGILQQFIDGIISAPARVLKSISIAQEFIYKQFNTNQYL